MIKKEMLLQALIIEKNQLDVKAASLRVFIGSDEYLKLSDTHQNLICKQYEAMYNKYIIMSEHCNCLKSIANDFQTQQNRTS